MAGLHFDITGENRNFLAALHGCETGVRKTASQMEQYGSQIEGMFNRIKTAAELSFAGVGLKEFAEKVATVRGEFQQLEVAFGTMLGSSEKARAMMNDMTRLAATTPFDLKGVADGAKQLLAYGMESEKVADTLRRLGDVAAGLGIQLGDLTYLYGTTMAQGRMYTQDLNQFTGRGIPMISELAKQFGVAESKVKDLVTEGKVGFPEVEKVIMSLTDEGGKFGGLMEAQSHTIVGQISNIEDSIDMMFNDLGKSSEGAINGVLEGVSYAVDNYEQFGSVILGVIAAYGEWKAAAMVVNGWNNMLLKQTTAIEEARQAQLTALAAKYNENTAATAANTEAEGGSAIARNANRSAIDGEIAAIEKSLVAKLEEQKVIEAAAVSELAAAEAKVSSAQSGIMWRERELAAAVASGDGFKIEAAETALNLQYHELNDAERARATALMNVETATRNRNTTATRLNTLQTEADTIQRSANATATGVWATVTTTATTAVKGLTAAIAANPVGALLVGLTTALSLIPMFTSQTEEATQEVTRFGEAAVKRAGDVDTLLAVIQTTSETSKVHKDSVDELCKIYDEYGIKIDKERNALEQLIDYHDILIGKIREEGEERQKANLLESYNEGVNKAIEEMRNAWVEAYKNAEYDGSGLFDDWDAKAFQEKADQIALVANAIAQDELTRLKNMVANGEEVTAQQISAAIAEATSKIKEQSEKLSGASLFMTSYDEIGKEVRHYIDIDYEGIMQGAADKVLNLASARRTLVKSMSDTKSALDEEKKSVDYSAMSFSDLIDKAYGAQDAVEEVGKTDGTPTIDTTPADKATKAIEGTQSALITLNSMTSTPFVDTKFINYAIGQAGTLVSTLNSISASPLFQNGVGGLSIPQFKLNTPKIGLNASAPKLGFGNNWNFGGGMYGYNPIATDTRASALAEINNRLNAANSDKAVSDLLKEVNEALEDATYGSEERKELVALRNKLQERKKKNSGTQSKTKKTTSKGKTTAEKVADEQERLDDMEDEVSLQRIRAAQDLANRLQKARLEAEGNSAEALRKQREQSNREEILDIERQRDDAIKAYVDAERKIFEQREKVKKTQNPNYKGQKFDEKTVDTSAIKSQYDEIIALTKGQQVKASLKEEEKALAEFLKTYGSYQEQRLAIQNEYQKKIDAATTMGGRLSLQREMETALSDLDMEKFKKDINWEVIFNDLDKVSSDYLTRLRERLKTMLSADGISAENAKVIAEQIDKINAAIDSKANSWKSAFGLVIPELEEIKRLEKEAEDAKQRLTTAEQDYNLKRTARDFTRRSIADYAQEQGVSVKAEDVTTANSGEIFAKFKQLGKSTDNLESLFSKLGKSEQDVIKSEADMAEANAEAEAATAKASGGIERSVSMIGAMANLVNDQVQGAADFFNDTLQMADTSFAKGFTNFAESSQYATAAFESLKSGDFFGVINNVAGALGSLGDALAEWGLSSIFGSTDTTLASDIERLTFTNELLIKSVDNLSKKMEDTAIANAKDVYDQQLSNLRQAEANTRELMQRSADASSKGFLGIGSSASSNAKINEGVTSAEWDRLSKLLGKNIRTAQDFFNLSSKEMYDVLTEVPDIYAHIKSLADDGYKDAAAFMDDYISYWEQIQEAEDAYFEKLTSTSFDTIVSDFQSALMDMDSDSEDFADNFEKYIQNAIISSLVSDKYKEALKKWYDDFATYMETDNTLTADEAQRLKDSYNAIVESGVAMRDALIDTFGWETEDTYKQEASSKGFSGMSQDVANELNGRFTSVQINTQETAQRMLTTINLLSTISSGQSEGNRILSDILRQSNQSNEHLRDVVDYTKKIYNNFTEKIDSIVTNTGRI